MTQRFSPHTKKTSKSFVIEDDILKLIEAEAQKNNISTNSQINAILAKWAFFYRAAEKEECATIASSTREFIIKEIDEQKWIEEYTSVLINTIPAILLESNMKINILTIVKMVFERSLLYSRAYQGFTYFLDDEGYLTLAFRHNSGLKYSRIIGNAYSAFFTEVLRMPNSLEVSERLAKIKVLLRNTKEINDLLEMTNR